MDALILSMHFNDEYDSFTILGQWDKKKVQNNQNCAYFVRSSKHVA